MSAISKKTTGRIGTTLAAAVLATTAFVGLSAAPAQAAPPDGKLYAWQHDNRGGAVCTWTGNDGDWSTCGVGETMRNRASSIHNNGYTHAARLYYTGARNSAWACLYVGTAWFWMNRDGDRGPKFNLGADNAPGRNQLVNDNVARHTWHQTCS